MANQSKLICEHFELHSFLESNNSYWNRNQNNDIVVFRDQYELSENIFLSDNKRNLEIITLEN